MSDHYVDNANFFSVEHPEAIADQELYDLITTEYPVWLLLMGLSRDPTLLAKHCLILKPL